MDPSTNADPLGDFIPKLDPTTTARPCPIKGDYLFQITKIEPALGKVDPDDKDPEAARDPEKKMLAITLTSLVEMQSVKGKLIAPGFEIVDRALLYQPPKKPGKQEFDFTAAIARRYDAIYNTDDDNRPEDYARLLGQSTGAKVVLNLEPFEDKVYGWKPEIKKWKTAPAGA